MNTPDPSWDYAVIYEQLMEISEDLAIALSRLSEQENASEQLDGDIKLCLHIWKDKLTKIIEDLEDHL